MEKTLLDNTSVNHVTGYTKHAYAKDHGWSVDAYVSSETYESLHESFQSWGEVESCIEKFLNLIAKLKLGWLFRRLFL